MYNLILILVKALYTDHKYIYKSKHSQNNKILLFFLYTWNSSYFSIITDTKKGFAPRWPPSFSGSLTGTIQACEQAKEMDQQTKGGEQITTGINLLPLKVSFLRNLKIYKQHVIYLFKKGQKPLTY